jgi:hypothetical protein
LLHGTGARAVSKLGAGLQSGSDLSHQGIVDDHARFEVKRLDLENPILAVGFGIDATDQRTFASVVFSVILIRSNVLILRISFVWRHGRIASVILLSKTGIFINNFDGTLSKPCIR